MHTAQDTTSAHEIGRYHLVAELARGGMGIIHLAVSHGPGGFSKLLVVKELKPELAHDPDYVAMFLDEARLAARLAHRNIVQTLEVGSDAGRHYMVMELLDGRSLHRIGRRSVAQGGLPVGAQLRVITEALLGLHYAHELRDFDGLPMGIVHRDVSPLNVFVTFEGQAKVIDFGIAKSADSSLETKTGMLKGRVAYMAPEQAWGRNVDRRADVYSAGVMIWEAAAGRRLWPGMPDVEILARGLREGPPALRFVRPDVPQELEAICSRAMARDPDERYATAADLLDDLERHLAKRPDAVSMREVGAHVSRLFAEERRKMNGLIEETLSRVRNGPRSGVMPTFDVHVRGTPSGAMAHAEEPSRASELLLLSPSLDAPWMSVAPTMAASGVTSGPLSTPAPWWVSRRAILAGSSAGLLLVVVVVFAAFYPTSEPSGQPSVGATAGALAPTRADPELVDLVVRVSPPSAQITIDGLPVAGNPFHAHYARDGQVHHVLAAADGFDPKLEDVSFSGDVSIDVSLDRHASPPSPARYVVVVQPPRNKHAAAATSPSPSPEPATPTPPAAPPPRADVPPAGGHPPLRPIMTSDPYGNQ
jgi:serine/threonine protein kinase